MTRKRRHVLGEGYPMIDEYFVSLLDYYGCDKKFKHPKIKVGKKYQLVLEAME